MIKIQSTFWSVSSNGFLWAKWFYCASSFAVTVWCSHIILSLDYNTGFVLCFDVISSSACPLSFPPVLSQMFTIHAHSQRGNQNILSGSLTMLRQHCVLMESRVWMRAWNSHSKQTPGSVDATCLMAVPGDCRSDMLFKARLPARG